MTHMLFAIGVLLGAAVSYAIGFTLGSTAFLVAGVLFEVAFWGSAFICSKKNGAA